jgi:hypothetical protein
MIGMTHDVFHLLGHNAADAICCDAGSILQAASRQTATQQYVIWYIGE